MRLRKLEVCDDKNDYLARDFVQSDKGPFTRDVIAFEGQSQTKISVSSA